MSSYYAAQESGLTVVYELTGAGPIAVYDTTDWDEAHSYAADCNRRAALVR